MERLSNRDRIARAAEEARLTAVEKAATKAAKSASGTRPKRAAQPVRMKIVWEVATENGKTVETFLYPDKPAAEAKAAALTMSTGRPHAVRAAKVPME
ncbi:MAG: hypothetical protein L0323_13250 [Planctomycetes bacterium]|nr:hypothetical protein [Planctomycetota bacterium]